jgi:type III secretion system HrpB7-like protein
MASGGTNASAKRRIIALERSTARRRRLDESLRSALGAQRNQHISLEAARDEKIKEVEHEASIRRHYEGRIDAMMSGGEPFSLNDLNSCRLYADIVAERQHSCEVQVESVNGEIQDSLNVIAQTQRDIALNLGRIDTCEDQVKQIRRQQDELAATAADEEAEETALARRFRDREMST